MLLTFHIHIALLNHYTPKWGDAEFFSSKRPSLSVFDEIHLLSWTNINVSHEASEFCWQIAPTFLQHLRLCHIKPWISGCIAINYNTINIAKGTMDPRLPACHVTSWSKFSFRISTKRLSAFKDIKIFLLFLLDNYTQKTYHLFSSFLDFYPCKPR